MNTISRNIALAGICLPAPAFGLFEPMSYSLYDEGYSGFSYNFSMVFSDPKPSFGISYEIAPDDPLIEWDNDIGYRVRNFSAWSAVFEIQDPERVANPIILDPHQTALNGGLGLSFQIAGENFLNDVYLTIRGTRYHVNDFSPRVTYLDEGSSGGLDLIGGNLVWNFDPVSVPELAVLELLAGGKITVEFVPDYTWTAKLIPWLGTYQISSVTGPSYLLMDPSVAIPEPAATALAAAVCGLLLIQLRRRGSTKPNLVPEDAT